MGMGYAAAHDIMITEANLMKICPETLTNFLAVIEQIDDELIAVGSGMTFEDYARSARYDDDWLGECGVSEKQQERLAIAFVALQSDFSQKTETAYAFENIYEYKIWRLTLHLDYHSEDDGDRYDDVSGGYFSVGNVRQYTPAGEKFKELLDDVNFVIYG